MIIIFVHTDFKQDKNKVPLYFTVRKSYESEMAALEKSGIDNGEHYDVECSDFNDTPFDAPTLLWEITSYIKHNYDLGKKAVLAIYQDGKRCVELDLDTYKTRVLSSNDNGFNWELENKPEEI